MKDFDKTIVFMKDFNGFSDIISLLWNSEHNHHPHRIDVLIADMRKYSKATICRGEELSDEVKSVCPNVLELKQYISIWENLLGSINTIWMDDDEVFNAELWEYRLNDYFLAHDVVAMLKQMKENYRDVKNNARSLKESYGLKEYEESIYTGSQQTFVNYERNKTDIPHDILRLFGGKNTKYQDFIEACQNRCPKDIARLYKKHGEIQDCHERGVVTLLYKHLEKIGILHCSIRNFQKHYSQVENT